MQATRNEAAARYQHRHPIERHIDRKTRRIIENVAAIYVSHVFPM
jgi:hypothetical protein